MRKLCRSRALFSFLLVLWSGCQPKVADFSFSHHWIAPAPAGKEEGFTDTRVRIWHYKVRWENDFELYLLDLNRREIIELRRLSETSATSPFLPFPNCPAADEILARRQCAIHHRSGAEPVSILCRHADYQWEFTGRRQVSPPSLLETFYQMELLPDEAFCLLRDYPLSASRIKISRREKGQDQVLELRQQKNDRSPLTPGLFASPSHYRAATAVPSETSR